MANHLTHTLNESLDALNRVASGDSLCTLSGERVEAAKYLEGQVIALKLALRLVTAEEERDREPTDLIRCALDEWAKKNPESFSQAPSWVSYRLGGIDVLDSAARFANGK